MNYANFLTQRRLFCSDFVKFPVYKRQYTYPKGIQARASFHKGNPQWNFPFCYGMIRESNEDGGLP